VSRATRLPPALCGLRRQFGGHPMSILRRPAGSALASAPDLDAIARGDVFDRPRNQGLAASPSVELE
jgi:hypothetical protein